MNSIYEGKFKVSQIQHSQHSGMDLVGLTNKKIFSNVNGTVEKLGWENASNKKQGFGMRVWLKDTNGLYHVYGHLNYIQETLKVGDKVKVGDYLGQEGNTGYSFGSHCHYEVRTCIYPKKSLNAYEFLEISNKLGTYEKECEDMTTKEKYNQVCEMLNIKEYHDKGFKGQGIKIASVESLKSEHGRNVFMTLKTYAPECEVISFNDEFNISATGDQNTPDTINFPKFVDWCIEQKVDIVTSSLDWSTDEELEKQAVRKLYESGIVFVNCVPNVDDKEVKHDDSLNCTYHWKDEIISVGGLILSTKGKETYQYAYGEAVDVLSYNSCVPVHDLEYDSWYSISGNSFATPMVASVLAVAMSKGHKINSKSVLKFIEENHRAFEYDGLCYDIICLPSVNADIFDVEEEVKVKSEVSEWAKESWYKAYDKGILDGTRPTDNITRQEIAVILDRLKLLA